jgi:tetratricopeptide (TPR) repeat protein
VGPRLREHLDRFTTGVLPAAERGGDPLDAERIGALALAYATTRASPAIAARLVAEAKRRGGGAHALITEAYLALQENPDRVEAARAQLDQAVAMQPDAFAGRWQRAQLLFDQDEYEAALADVDVALRAAPADLRVRHLRLQLLTELDRMADARAEANVLVASPYVESVPSVLAEAAAVAAGIGRIDEAIGELRRYLVTSPDDYTEWDTLAELYAVADRTEEARAARQNAGIAQRNLVLMSHAHALRAERRGDREEAASLFRNALELDPAYAPAQHALRRLGTAP